MQHKFHTFVNMDKLDSAENSCHNYNEVKDFENPWRSQFCGVGLVLRTFLSVYLLMVKGTSNLKMSVQSNESMGII